MQMEEVFFFKLLSSVSTTHIFFIILGREVFSSLALAVLGLRCYVPAPSSCGEQGLLLAAELRLLTAVASLV